MVVSARERSNLPQQIKSILDGYPLGGAILREFLQNSDDAKATKQIFILDPRDHPKEHVADPALKECQGPALLAINDTLFSESDWEALGTIHGSNKATDETKTGKYGLGFRACYHLTDNPHVLSGDRLRIFDPHEAFQGLLAGGLYINTVTEAVAYADHITAFQAAEATPQEAYNGTAIRLPLRTQDQAEKSQIRSTAFSVDDIRSLFTNLVNGELGITLLFLKHIRSVELREIELSGTVKVIGRMEISGAEGSLRSDLSAGQRSFQCQTIFQGLDGQPQTRDWRIIHHLIGRNEACEILLPRLEYSLDELNDALRKEKLRPHVGLAIPLDSLGVDCPLFTLLPLPIRLGLPLCLHGTFALTSDRQHLKNNDDNASKQHREGLLVHWNRMIFDTLAPEAWAKMLRVLIKEDYPSLMRAWPPFIPDPSTYSSTILPNLLKIVVDKHLRVFPVLSSDNKTPSSYVPFQDALFYSPKLEATLIELLVRVGLPIVEPPVELLPILEEQLRYTTLSPKTASGALKSHPGNLSKCSADEKDMLLEYALSDTSDSTRLKNLIGLPLLPIVNGVRVSISNCTPESKIFVIPATPMEEKLFGQFEQQMVTLSTLPTSVRPILANYTGDLMLSLRIRSAGDIISYLEQAVDDWEFAGVQVDGVSDEHIDWLVQFWNNVDLPTDIDAKQLQQFQKLQLIPTNSKSIRRVDRQILSLQNMDDGASQALIKLDVHPLHMSISPSNPRIANYCRTDFPFLIDLINTKKLDSLESKDWDATSNYLTRLSNSSSQQIKLSPLQLSIFKGLKIFPTWTGGISGVHLDSIVGDVQFISGTCQFPVPVLPSPCTFVLSSRNITLSRLLEPNARAQTRGEPAILQLAIDNWTEQPPDSQEAYIDRIIARFSDLSESHQSKFISFPFVSVGSKCLPPSQVVDPSSSLHNLYLNEGFTPTEAFRVGTKRLQFLQAHGLLASSLTPERVAERIKYIFDLGPTTESVLKAIVLLQLLDQSWDPSFTDVVKENRAASWLPRRPGSKLLTSPNQCRDSATNSSLFDLCFDILPFQLKSTKLRKALGWDTELPTPTVLLQLERSLGLVEDAQKLKRVKVIIKELSDRFDRNSLSVDLERLHDIVNNREWIPSHSGKLLDVRHAMLSADFLGGKFHQIHHSLSGRIDFLKKMGCKDCPTLEALLDDYQGYTTTELSGEDSKWIIRILEELSRHDLSASTANLLLPGRDGLWWPHRQTYYDDLRNRAVSSHDVVVYPVHPSISSALAKKLKIPLLSALELDQDEDEDEGEDKDEDDEGMGETLVDRIKNVLNDYDIKHAFNEFVANASDAGATKLSILLDERSTFPSESIISPDMKRFQQVPAVVLYNDELFTTADFEGIRHIGRGTKRERPDAIGKYGLGALSIFHFTDLPMIISGKYVMILDPSGNVLPLKKGNKRTVLFRKLSTFSSRYPDQLEPFRGLFDIPLTGPIDEFQGTLFRLPLPVGIPCRLPTDRSLSDWCGLLQGYQGLGRDGFFFTRMVQLRAGHISHRSEALNLKVGYWWCGRVLGREVSQRPEHTVTDLKLSLNLYGKPAASEHWIITTSTYPSSCAPVRFQPILWDLKIRQPDDPIIIQTASPLFTYSDFYLFSTLRLPQAIGLPFHLQAPFAIPSSRRHIHFDSRDATGGTTLPTEYNTWVLQELVSKHYLPSLEALQPLTDDLWEHWPVGSESSDVVSRLVSQSFYNQLPTSLPIIHQSLSGRWLAPIDAKYLLEAPHSVQSILQRFEGDSVVIPPQRLCHAFTDHPSIITPNLLAEVLHRHQNQIRGLFMSKTISSVHIDDLLAYLLSGKVDTSSLPLLMVADGTLRSRSSAGPIYHILSPFNNLTKWISPSRVLDNHSHKKSMELLLADPDSGVREFSDEDVCALLLEKVPASPATIHSPEITQWIQDFWAVFLSFPKRPTWDQLADFPIVPTYQDHHQVSLHACRDGTVLPSYSFPKADIHNVLSTLNISMVRFKVPLILQDLLCEETFSIITLLKCLDEAMKLNPSICEVPCFDQLAEWIRENLKPAMRSDRAMLDVIQRLPIWEACLHNHISLHPLGDISLLPWAIPHNHEIVKQYTRRLLSNQDQIAHYSDKKRLKAGQILNLLDFPGGRIPYHHLASYADFLRLLITPSSAPALKFKVPDGDCIMRPAHELYDINVELFARVFRGPQEKAKFIHPLIRNQLPSSVSSYLQNKVNTETVLTCAQVLHDDLDSLPTKESRDRARLIYKAFTKHLPSQVMTNSATWARFDDIQFIPRADSRCRHANYDVQTYLSQNPLPDVVSPSRIVSRQYERIAWTQRALIPTDPKTSNLLSVNPQFGVPDASDVVKHLHFLATRIAPDHPGDASLIEDLEATYQWLKEHQLEAQGSLSRYEDVPIFLNVDDPRSRADDWSQCWRSARQLMLGVTWDSNGTCSVRKFLKQYEAALRAGGVKETQRAEYLPKSPSDAQDSLRDVFNKMRLAGTHTDVYLVPTKGNRSEDTYTQRLSCHTSFLAASCLRGAPINWRKTGNNSYPFPGTFVGAYVFLEFIYAGNITIPRELVIDDEASRADLLDEFLSLLELADQLGMDTFKEEIGRTIVDTFQLLELHTYASVKKRAESCHADALVSACDDFEQKND
ncbi:hypothetical protein BDN72DRAFT_803733 [Pluteus cervinus]|uniref:Uncharacterized protein n=1 Tax=Pluteus cervinus TaxID=181527 RepID=A0ACD3ABA6_9AGAR|nr:hypothetical protein BDN72DRAFT_803733 [Pluteus cervinus]